jgi:hypothetical protein
MTCGGVQDSAVKYGRLRLLSPENCSVGYLRIVYGGNRSANLKPKIHPLLFSRLLCSHLRIDLSTRNL